mgnify:CR=1 FL=1|jgi:hypothetical protein
MENNTHYYMSITSRQIEEMSEQQKEAVRSEINTLLHPHDNINLAQPIKLRLLMILSLL